MFGTGPANMLEATVVTANGEVVTASEFQNQDLFYALRGGGYGFGVVISLTVRTHPLPAVFGFINMGIKSKSRPGMEGLVTKFLELYRDKMLGTNWGEQVKIEQKDVGYAFGVSMLTLLTSLEIYEAWEPLITWAQASPNEYAIESLEFMDFPARRFWDINRMLPDSGTPTPYDPREPERGFVWNTNFGEISSYWLGYVSRWLQNDQFLTDTVTGAKNLLDLVDGTGSAQLHLNKAQNGAPQWAVDELNKTPMHPSIKNSFGLWIGGGSVGHYSPLVSESAQLNTSNVKEILDSEYCKTDRLDDCDFTGFYQAVNRFREVTPGSGAYFNEADYNEPDWQNTFWGQDNYKRLLDIKNRWDPEELFYCHNCVGSETWQEGGMCKRS